MQSYVLTYSKLQRSIFDGYQFSAKGTLLHPLRRNKENTNRFHFGYRVLLDILLMIRLIIVTPTLTESLPVTSVATTSLVCHVMSMNIYKAPNLIISPKRKVYRRWGGGDQR